METPDALHGAVPGRASPSTMEECLKKAAECVRKAGEAADPLVRQQFTDLARQWRDMADMAKRYEW